MYQHRSGEQFINDENMPPPHCTSNHLIRESLKSRTGPNQRPSKAVQRSRSFTQNQSKAFSLLSRRPSSSRVHSLKDLPPQQKDPIKVQNSTIVVVGDSNCGKSSLVVSYINGAFSSPPRSVLFETYEKTIRVNEYNVVNLQIWDFPGADSFDRFRPLGYVNAKCILICFTLDSLETLYHIRERWIPEIETHCPRANKFIIGIGSEARCDRTKVNKVPKFDYCYKFARKLDCRYLECSLIDPASYNKIFEKVALESIDEYDSEDGLIMAKTRNKDNVSGSNIQILEDSRAPLRKTSFKRSKSYCILM